VKKFKNRLLTNQIIPHHLIVFKTGYKVIHLTVSSQVGQVHRRLRAWVVSLMQCVFLFSRQELRFPLPEKKNHFLS
jgi:hypothetical protein